MSKNELKVIIQEMKEPIVTKKATDRMVRILDSKYEKADLKAVIAGAYQLSKKEKQILYKILVKFKEVFDGMLGEWYTDPVKFERVNRANPHSQTHYPVPHLYKQTFRKELDCLVKLGVLEKYKNWNGGC